nr:pentapeptide repeat-containing protein [Dendronalium sp. ChiSLP03b]MDZ8207523.1 pentapeptide repeat-containing protein [Dendronalium sp. ChiSLP03b]
MSVNNGNTTSNGTKAQATQSQTLNTKIDGNTAEKTQLNNLEPTNDTPNPKNKDPELNSLESKELKWFRPIELGAASLGAIIIPILVAWAGWRISDSQFKTQQTDNQHTILKEYIDSISSLSLEKDLTENETEAEKRNEKIQENIKETFKSKPKSTKEQLEVFQSIKTAKDLSDTAEDARTMAIGQTQTALRRLDSEYKGYLIRFLHESNLIKSKIKVYVKDKVKYRVVKKPATITLKGANINGVKLKDASLPLIELEGTYLNKADLSNAGLQGANLKSAKLQNANLKSAKLQPAKLSLFKITPERTITTNIATNLQGASLEGADLQGANFQGVKNLTPKQITSAKNWQQACYDKEFNKQLDDWESENNLRSTTQNREKSCENF